AIRYAEEGFPVSEIIAHDWQSAASALAPIPTSAACFLPDGKAPAPGGLFSARDFADHTSTWVEPVSTNYRGYDVWELPPNGQGIAVLQMLNLLEPYDLRAMGPSSAEYLHLFLEAKKLAYADR